MQDNLFNQGLELMVYGMGTVFVFLVLMVGATRLLSALVERLGLQDPEPATVPVAPDPDQRRLVAVIAAAVQQHRNSSR